MNEYSPSPHGNSAGPQALQPAAQPTRQEQIAGVLLGTAVGDALGLPAEGLSPRRIARLWRGNWRMRLFFGETPLVVFWIARRRGDRNGQSVHQALARDSTRSLRR